MVATARRGTRKSDGAVVLALPYGRVSTDEQGDEGLSLGAQQARVLGYVADRGWRAGTWRQDVESGRKVDRTQYQALLADVRQLRREGRPVAVVVVRGDRLGRRLSEFARAYEELTSLGATLHSVREGGELSLLTAGMLGTMAAEESRRIGERVSEVISHVHGGGWYFPGRCPWGYLLRPASSVERAAGAPVSVLDVHPVEAPYAREALERIAGGEALRAVARWVASLPEEARGGRVMSYQSVSTMVRARVYAGQTPDGHAGRWEALVTRETWDAVQRQLAGVKRGLPRQASMRYLLSGLIYCPKCGARMAGNAINGGKYPRYVCHSATDGARAIGGPCYATVTAPVIDQAVLDAVAPVVLRGAGALRDVLAELAREHDAIDQADASAVRIAELERMRATARREISELARKLARGELSQLAYQVAVADAEADYHGAEQEIERLQAERNGAERMDLPALVQSAEAWGRAWHVMDLRARRELLSALLARVSYEREGGRCSPVRAVLEWTREGEYLRGLLGLSGVAQGAEEGAEESLTEG